jgi:hypothetical protein
MKNPVEKNQGFLASRVDSHVKAKVSQQVVESHLEISQQFFKFILSLYLFGPVSPHFQ